jgi:predicted enzyme related to lactoylglutathione lyase
MIKGVDFVSIPTRDIEASRAFYADAVGLPCSVHIPERGYAEFETGNLTLSVFNMESVGRPHNPNPNPVALHVDDVANARAELESRGVEFAGEILDTGVCHMAFFRDPDGNTQMLHHRYKPRGTTD